MNSSSPARGLGLAPRERAHTILHEVLDRGRPLDEVLQADRQFAKLNERDRAFARNLVATTLRRLGQIDAIIADCIERPLPRSAAPARNAIRLGICQILYLDVQIHAAVDTAVALCAHRGAVRFKGLVNAILRRLVREGPESLEAKYPVSLNVPDWLRLSWAGSVGAETADRIAAVQLHPPPLDLTVREDAAGWAQRLGGEVIAGNTVRLTGGGDVAAMPGFAAGAWWVQDAAAALPARILAAALGAGGNGARVCDLCAAPGGKTAQLAAAGFDVTAVDTSAERMVLVRENLARLKLSAHVVEADATEWLADTPFDAVLLDAPCSATGTIRRHPDIPYLKRPADVIRQSTLQKKLLHNAASLVRPGGTLVYSVCSLQPEEGREQVADFLAGHGAFARNPVLPSEIAGFESCVTENGDVLTTPAHIAEKGGVDGFYVARLRCDS